MWIFRKVKAIEAMTRRRTTRYAAQGIPKMNAEIAEKPRSLAKRSLRQLHGHAMQRPVLENERQTVDADDLPPGKGFRHCFQGSRVILVAVCGNENRAIDDQEIGVGGRESFEAIIAGSGPGEGDQPER